MSKENIDDENSCLKCGKKLCNKYFAKKHMEKCKKSLESAPMSSTQSLIPSPPEDQEESDNNIQGDNFVLRSSSNMTKSRIRVHTVRRKRRNASTNHQVTRENNEDPPEMIEYTSEANTPGHDTIVFKNTYTERESADTVGQRLNEETDNDEENNDDEEGSACPNNEDQVVRDITKYMLIKEMRLFTSVAEVIGTTPYRNSEILQELMELGIKHISRIIHLMDLKVHVPGNEPRPCNSKHELMKELVNLFNE